MIYVTKSVFPMLLCKTGPQRTARKCFCTNNLFRPFASGVKSGFTGRRSIEINFIQNFGRRQFLHLNFMPRRFYGYNDNGKSGSLRFLCDVNLYFKICEEIKTGSNAVSPIQLAYIPFGTVNHNEGKYFTYNILPLWWKLLEKNLTQIHGDILASTIYGLYKLNYSCRGDVMKYLNFNDIEKLALHSLSGVKSAHFGGKSFTMLLNGMAKLIEASSGKNVISNQFKLEFSKAFSLFFSPELVTEKSNVANSVGSILFYSAKLGLISSPFDELKAVVPLCQTVFTGNNLIRSEQSLNNCHRIGSAFLIWNFIPEQKFFLNYFKAIERTYDNYKHKERLCATVLKISLLIGLKLCENEFNDFSSFWKCEMKKLVHCLRRGEIDEILDLCLQIYNGNVRQIENILSKDIFLHLLNRTDSFGVSNINGDDILCITSQPLGHDKGIELDKASYLHICQLLVNGNPVSISASTLNHFPYAAVNLHEELSFVKTFSNEWWSNFKPKLQEIKGYLLVASLFGLLKINKKVNGELRRQFANLKENPVEKIALFALKDIQSEHFTHRCFNILLETLYTFRFDDNNNGSISSKMAIELSNAFASFFNPQFFHQRKFVHECHTQIGKILFFANLLSISLSPNDQLKIIIDCCSRNFDVRITANDAVLAKNHLWNLCQAADTFVARNLDADIQYPSFWKLYFKQIQIHYSKLGQSSEDTKLKIFIMKTSLLVVLKFRKEISFEEIKPLWQFEMKLFIDLITDDDINEIFILSKEHGMFDHLLEIVSEPILDEFERRVPVSY